MKIIAYEFYNCATGHCYVDYMPKPGMDEKEGYTKIPLIEKPELLTEEDDEKTINDIADKMEKDLHNAILRMVRHSMRVVAKKYNLKQLK